jgi:phage shock protein C
MYCNQCGKQIQDDAALCAYCGRRVGYEAAQPQRLIRPARNSPERKIAGVCAGFAQYFDLDVTVVRVVWLIVACFGGGGVLAYIIAWIVMPEAPEVVMIPAPGQMAQTYHQ